MMTEEEDEGFEEEEEQEAEFDEQINYDNLQDLAYQQHLNQVNKQQSTSTQTGAQPQQKAMSQAEWYQQQLDIAFQPGVHVQQVQKMRDDVQNQLKLCLTDMLVNLYNSKEQSVYESLYIKVIQKLHWQSKNVYTPIGHGPNNTTVNSGIAFAPLSSKDL